MNVGQAEGILVQEPEVEVEPTAGEEGTAGAHIESLVSDDAARKQLRDHLRRTLSDAESSPSESLHHRIRLRPLMRRGLSNIL